MKKNKKGFMLVETLVVSTLVSTILISLYVQFNNILKNFNRDFTYNSVNNLYAIQNVKQLILSDTEFFNNLKTILADGNHTSSENGTYFLEISPSCDANDKHTGVDTAYALTSDNCTKMTKLKNFYGIKTIIFTYSYVDLNETDYEKLNSPNLEKFVRSIKNNASLSEGDDGIIDFDYRIIVEFNNNEYATLKIYS